MITRTDRTIAAALCALLLPGCASMMNSGKQSLTINSNPQGALVYENGAEVGTTPYKYTYDKPEGGAVNLELRKEGHEHRVFEITPQQKSGVLLLDALLLNIPYYLGDSKSTAIYAFPQEEFSVNLYKDLPAEQQHKDLPIVTLENRIPAGTGFGSIGSRRLNNESRELDDLDYPDQLTSSFGQGLRNTWIEPHSVRLATQKGDEEVRAAKMYLRPVIKGVDMKLTEVDNRVFGTVDLDMEWKFMSGVVKDSVLFTFAKRTTYPVFAESARDVLSLAAKDAARQLVDEAGLAERMGRSYDAGLVSSKGSIVQLRTPKPIPFNGRKEMLSALVKGVVTVETSDGHGSGFLVTNDGYLLTNAHVVEDDATVKVKFQQGFTLDGTVVKVNKDFDIALIKTPGSDLPALSIGDDAGLQLGEEIFAIGTPLDEKLGQTVTRGIMSGRREFEGRSFLQTDVSINPGNSGGPLIDETGKVVGVATLKVSGTGVQGIGFGVPMSKAIEMLNLEFNK